MTLPLDGVRVVEIAEQAFVPSAGAALADYGADVVKVERLAGDPIRSIIARGMVPSADGVDFLFEIANRNKRTIALDITVPAGREVLEKLVRTADVFLTNQLPQVQRKLRTGPDDIFALKPDIVFARGHGQGQRGPEAEAGGYDGVSYWARGGLSHLLTSPVAHEPAVQRPALGDLPSGMFLMGGICAALVRVARTGQGTIVDTALLNAAAWTLSPDLAYTSLTDEQMVLMGEPRSPLTVTYKTADGRFVQFMMINENKYWQTCAELLGLEEVGTKYADPTTRREHWPELGRLFAEAVGRIKHDDLIARLRERNCIFSGYATPADVLRDPAATANGYLMAHPTHPTLKIPAPPVQFDNTPAVIRRAAPRLGEHTVAVLAELGYSDAAAAELIAAGTAVDGAAVDDAAGVSTKPS